MTKYSKVLTSTLLATSVIAFSASASYEAEDDLGRIEVTTRERQKVSPAKVFVTNDLQSITLKINANDLTNKAKAGIAPSTTGKTTYSDAERAKVKAKLPMNVALPAVDFGSRKAVEITKKDGTTVTYTIDTKKPHLVEYYKIATHPDEEAANTIRVADPLWEGDLKAVTKEKLAQEDITRQFDLVSAVKQARLNESRKSDLLDAKKDLEWISASLKALQETYTAVYKAGHKVWGASNEEYWTALKASKDKIDAEKPVVLEVVLLKGKTEQASFYAGQIAAAAIPTFSPKEALGRQEVTKGDLTVLEYGDLITVGLLKDVKAVPIVVDVNYPMEDAIALSKEVKDLAKLKREVEDLSVKVKAELDAVWPENGTKSKMWAQYEPVLEGKATYLVPAAAAAPAAPEAAIATVGALVEGPADAPATTVEAATDTDSAPTAEGE